MVLRNFKIRISWFRELIKINTKTQAGNKLDATKSESKTVGQERSFPPVGSNQQYDVNEHCKRHMANTY